MALAETTLWLRELVSLPSINPGGATRLDPSIQGEARVTDWLENWAKNRQIPHYRQPVLPNRDNLIMDTGPISGGSQEIQLWEVHQDTVDVAGMTVPPFGGEIRDGKLFGRGACDVKGPMTAMLSALEKIHRLKPPGASRVVLACTIDEEHTFQGVLALRGKNRGHVVAGPDREIRPSFAVVAEPSRLAMITAHKGVIRWNVTVTGSACHSSTPWLGNNAIYGAAIIANRIREMQMELEKKGREGLDFGSISLTQVQGGSAPNIVPQECVLFLDRRVGLLETPEGCQDQLVGILQALVLPDGLTWNLSAPVIRCPALGSLGNEGAPARLSQALEKVTGQALATTVSFGTDASTLAEHGIPSVVFGPGDIRQAHTKDEWIDLAEIEKAAEILFVLAKG